MSSIELKPTKTFEQHRFHFLDALRGLAAICVALLHFPRSLGLPTFVESSYLAVDFFFCLSGFVVAFSYQDRLATTLGFREFSLLRLTRLYPTALLGTALGALLLFSDHSTLVWRSLPLPAAIGYAVTSGLLILPLPKGPLFPLDVPMWTLFLELLINFGFGLMIRFRLASNIVLFAIAGLSYLALLYDRSKYYKVDFGLTSYSFFVGVHRVCFSFFAGVLLYRLYAHRRPARLHTTLAFIVAAFGIGLLAMLFITPADVIHRTGADMLSIAVGFPMLVYWGARVQLPSFTTKTFAAMGMISYPLYMLHQPLLHPLYRLHTGGDMMGFSIGLAYLLAIIVLAWLVAKYYEAPVRQTIFKKLRA